MTRPAPHRLASWTARVPTPPAAAWTTTDSPSAAAPRCAAGARRSCPAGPARAPGRRRRRPGTSKLVRRRRERPLGVAAAGEQRDHAAAVREGARPPRRPGRAGRVERCEVGVLGLVGVGVVDAGVRDGQDARSPGPGSGSGWSSTRLEDLGTAELGDADRAHVEAFVGDRWPHATGVTGRPSPARRGQPVGRVGDVGDVGVEGGEQRVRVGAGAPTPRRPLPMRHGAGCRGSRRPR